MTALSVAQSVAVAVGLDAPATLFSSTTRDGAELRELLHECARRVVEERSWQTLTRLATITGDGATEAHALPSDYDWMEKSQQLWSSSLETALTHIHDRDEWLSYDVQSLDFVYFAWIMIGDQILIKPTLDTGVTVKYYYQSNLIAQSAAGTNKAAFTADDDVLRLPERLLKLCMIWQYREDKGLPYAEDMATYQSALNAAATREQGSKVLTVGSRRLARGVSIAYPRTIAP